ncbi:hypothetical protein CHS0354_031390 [Potamilus streckersoni]|uniref:Chromo domain-containing protein n=1 Tax=Potamilus streckersoni TaxID=2493646 RepID=A0AAE0SKB2_9BIVA|nr:hypothetical protein CHS0354_031390 [Potamilus streckersoni]
MNSERTAISTEQLVILESLWHRGMTSKGKKCSPLILEAVSKSGLNEKVVKGVINNMSISLLLISSFSMDTAVHTDSEYSGMIQEPTNSLDKQDEQTESHSQWTESKANPGPPDVCLKMKLEHTDLEFYSVKAIHAQRKRRGIQQYLVEWEGYTMKEASCEPKRNIPEEIINSLWGNKTHSINKE